MFTIYRKVGYFVVGFLEQPTHSLQTYDFLGNVIIVFTFERNHSGPKGNTLYNELMETATRSVEFSFNNEMYQQKGGVAMGSPLGPALANIFVGFHEERLFDYDQKSGVSDPYSDVLCSKECQTKKLLVCCKMFAFFKANFKIDFVRNFSKNEILVSTTSFKQ